MPLPSTCDCAAATLDSMAEELTTISTVVVRWLLGLLEKLFGKKSSPTQSLSGNGNLAIGQVSVTGDGNQTTINNTNVLAPGV